MRIAIYSFIIAIATLSCFVFPAIAQPQTKEELIEALEFIDTYVKTPGSDSIEIQSPILNSLDGQRVTKYIYNQSALRAITTYYESEESEHYQAFYYLYGQLVYHVDYQKTTTEIYENWGSYKRYFVDGKLVKMIEEPLFTDSRDTNPNKKSKRKKILNDIDLFSKAYKKAEFEAKVKESMKASNEALQDYQKVKMDIDFQNEYAKWNKKDTTALVKLINSYADRKAKEIFNESAENVTIIDVGYELSSLYDKGDLYWINNKVSVFKGIKGKSETYMFFNNAGDLIYWDIILREPVYEKSNNLYKSNETPVGYETTAIKYYFHDNQLVYSINPKEDYDNPSESAGVTYAKDLILDKLREVILNQ